MRMSDQPSVTIETVIDAPADTLYALASDLDVLGSFGTEFEGGEWLTGTPATEGATFLGRQRNGDRSWESTSTVTAARPGREFEWKVGLDDDGEAMATWRFGFRTVPDGTEVQYSVVLGSLPSGLTTLIDRNPGSEAEIIDKRLQLFQENMVKTLEGIRRRLRS